MATASWRGAIEVAGFTVNVALYNRVKSRSGESFRMIGTDDMPVHRALIEQGEFEKLEKDPQAAVRTIGQNDTRKGVEVAKGEYRCLSAEAVEDVTSAEKSELVSPHSYVPRDTLPQVADKQYAVVPDSKVPGAEGSVNLVWNGLRASELAYTAVATTRAGSRDVILAFYADDEGLYAVALPFEGELNDVPAWTPTVDTTAEAGFMALIKGTATVADAFDHSAYVSEYRTRRAKAIASVLSGKKPKATKKAPAAAPASGLAAALEAAVSDAGKPAKKAPAKKKATSKKKKVSA